MQAKRRCAAILAILVLLAVAAACGEVKTERTETLSAQAGDFSAETDALRGIWTVKNSLFDEFIGFSGDGKGFFAAALDGSTKPVDMTYEQTDGKVLIRMSDGNATSFNCQKEPDGTLKLSRKGAVIEKKSGAYSKPAYRSLIDSWRGMIDGMDTTLVFRTSFENGKLSRTVEIACGGARSVCVYAQDETTLTIKFPAKGSRSWTWSISEDGRLLTLKNAGEESVLTRCDEDLDGKTLLGALYEFLFGTD